jgi:hypothetical protein
MTTLDNAFQATGSGNTYSDFAAVPGSNITWGFPHRCLAGPLQCGWTIQWMVLGCSRLGRGPRRQWACWAAA